MNKKQIENKIKELQQELKNLENNKEKLYFGKYNISNIYDALKDINYKIRLKAYRVLGFTEKALKDIDEEIRLEAYRVFGFNKKALNDKDWFIRLEAYRQLGWTEKALNDKDKDIRTEAELYFEIQKALKKSNKNE